MPQSSAVEKKSKRSSRRIQHWYVITALLIVYDIVVSAFSYFFALWIRFDCSFYNLLHYDDGTTILTWYKFSIIYALLTVLVFSFFKLYKSIWRFASFKELIYICAAHLILFIFNVAGTLLFFGRMPVSYYVFGLAFQFVFTVAIRFTYRFVLLLREARSGGKRFNVMIVGAGESGRILLRDILHSHDEYRVSCFIDDNVNKWGRYIDGIPVIGGRDDILSAVQKYSIDDIYVAIPSLSPREKRDILNICKESGCKVKDLPGAYSALDNSISLSKMKDVSIEDLLGRDPISVNLDEVFSFIKGKVILVTGGGGSIGSELCRQVAAHDPKQLIIFDVYENNAFEISNELRHKFPKLDLVTLIGSVRDSRRINGIFEKYRPNVVYHAAAHKHVPLMEDSPCEAVKNNAIGTYKTAFAAAAYGTERFVLISTDKAVNPCNVMGASKRICEMVCQTFDYYIKQNMADKLPKLFEHYSVDGDAVSLKENLLGAKTEFVAVRFGNVLGSNGSVIPIFKKQIAEGGPITVTHPDIIRYFMTIPEAVSLVLQAGTYAHGGEIFVLDMGEPVKIDTLARNLIKLSGLKPDVDIKIEYTGLRPGEKLYEEKLMAEEGMLRTDNDLIHIGKPIDFDHEEFLHQLAVLMKKAYDNDENIRDYICDIVKTYSHN